jgi:hypothetical protein
MMFRMTFCSAQPEVILRARTSPMPGISRSRSGDCSMTSNTAAPKAVTSLPAYTGPMPLTIPEPR